MTVLVQKLDMLDADVVFYKGFFSSQQSEYFQKELMFKEAEWNQGSIKLFGKTLLEPRLSAYYGDYPYRYSGVSREPLPWNPILLEIKSLIEPNSGVEFNAALLNFYRNGNDGIGWHSDDETDLESPIIASVSFGASRQFIFRRKDDKTRKIVLELADGDLLVMGLGTQKYWQHQVPKTNSRKAIEIPSRINVTYRRVLKRAR